MEAMGLEPTNLLTASQALYQLSYAPVDRGFTLPAADSAPRPLDGARSPGHSPNATRQPTPSRDFAPAH